MFSDLSGEEIKDKFGDIEFTEISQYFDRSRSYFIAKIYKLYFLNKSFSAFDFILKNKIKPLDNFLVHLDSSLYNDIRYSFLPISDILIKSPATFDMLISFFNDNPKAESFITDIYFPSQFAFFFCSFFQEKASQFVSEYINTSNSKFVLQVAASFIRSSNKFRESLLNSFVQNKAKIYAKSLKHNGEDKDQISDINILIQSFFRSLHLLTIYQYKILQQIIQKSKEDATEMILKYILSPIVRNWEFSDFFIGTDLLFSNYEKENTDDEINRCKLLETLQQASYLESKENQELFDKFYSTYFDKEFVSHQETIALEELINSKQLKFGSTPLELNINKILLKIFESNNSPKTEDIQRMVDNFKSLLDQPANLFTIKLFGEDLKFSNSKVLSQQYECNPDYKDHYLFFQKIKVRASETLQDVYDYYLSALKKSQGSNYFESIINPNETLNKSIKNSSSAYREECKFSQEQRKLIGQRMGKARILKEEIKSAENVIDDLILKFIFKYNDQFNVNELVSLCSQKASDEKIIISVTDDTSTFIYKCCGINDDALKEDIKDFLINCKNPDEILSFLASKNEKYQSVFTQRDKILSIINQTSMCLKFERAKSIYIFSNIDFNPIDNAKLTIKNEDIFQNVVKIKEALQPFSSFSDIGILLGNRIRVPKLQNRGLYMIHVIKIMNIIMQIKYCIELNQNNNKVLFDDSSFSDIDEDDISFYMFYLFIDPNFDIKEKDKQDNFLNIFQMMFGISQLVNTFIQQCQHKFKFIDQHIINIIKNKDKQILDDSNYKQPNNEQQINIANDFEYMLLYSAELMNVNNSFLNYFVT